MTLGTTGKTLIPAAFHASIYLPGFPAPVVTIGTFSSITNCAISSAQGLINMIFTPNGLSVKLRQISIFFFKVAVSIPPAPIKPKAPAFDTLAANSPVAIFAIPP